MSILHHQSPAETLDYIGIDKNEKQSHKSRCESIRF